MPSSAPSSITLRLSHSSAVLRGSAGLRMTRPASGCLSSYYPKRARSHAHLCGVPTRQLDLGRREALRAPSRNYRRVSCSRPGSGIRIRCHSRHEVVSWLCYPATCAFVDSAALPLPRTTARHQRRRYVTSQGCRRAVVGYGVVAGAVDGDLRCSPAAKNLRVLPPSRVSMVTVSSAATRKNSFTPRPDGETSA